MRTHVQPEPFVAISILNWDGWQDTLECLESVRGLDYPNYLTVVVDNGSGDGSADKIKAWAGENLGPDRVIADYTRETALAGGDPEVEQALGRCGAASRFVLIRNEANLGFTGGHNVAVRYALGRAAPADHVFFLNNDAAIESGCLSRMISASHEADAGLVGALAIKGSGGVYFAGSGSFRLHLFRSLIYRALPPRQEEFWDSPIVYGAAMTVRRDVIEALIKRRGEFFREGLFAYGDEIELCWLAHKEGFRAVMANRAIVRHPANGARAPRGSRYFYYYSTRNNILIARAHLDFPSRLVFHAAFIPLCARRIVKRLLARHPERAWALARGLVDGYRGIEGVWSQHGGNDARSNGPVARAPVLERSDSVGS